MLRIRIFAAAAALCLTALLSQAAGAQTTVGKPLVLLAGLKPPHETRTIVHAKAAHKTHRKLAARKWKATARLAAKHHQDIAVQPEEPQIAPATLPENTAPAADSAPDTAAPADAAQNQDPNQVVVAGQTVQIAAPDQVNPIDLAADSADHPAPAAPSAGADDAAAAMPADSAAIAAPAQAVLAAPIREDGGANPAPVGSASWIAQVLAALGGAVTAGVVAWFLIGSGPVRTYG